MIPAFDPNAKDWLQALAWIAAALTLVVTAVKYRTEIRAGREQRERDLRWRQAEAGKKLNDEMLTDGEAYTAMRILDYDGRSFELPTKVTVPITHGDVAKVMDPASEIAGEKEIYIRECFDSLFYYMATLEHYISATLIRPEDVAYPLDYYVPLLAKFKPQVRAYLTRYELRRAQAFLARYDAWTRGELASGPQGAEPPAISRGSHGREHVLEAS